MRLTEQQQRDLDAFRKLPPWAVRTACSAPFLTMSFHPTGKVLSCSRKPATVIGDIRVQRLDDIWQSAVRKALMASLRDYQFAPGCAVCASYVGSGDYATADCVRTYAEFALTTDPEWPTRLEFNLANTCGLQCVACSGEYSSAIRAHRERLPPLPRVYGDQFFEDLRKYLRHVTCCVFLGGEPFSQQECYRIWDMLVAEGSRAHCYVNTNGTVYNARIEGLLAALRMTIAISFDGATAATVESTRVGASFATLLRNAKSFGARVAANGGELAFNFCPMRSNWREFPDFLLMAEDHGARAYVNTMVAPEELSLYFLPRAQLQEVVATLERRAAALGDRLGRNVAVMDELLAMLRNKLHADREGLRIALEKTEAQWRSQDRLVEDDAMRRAADIVERAQRVLSDPSYPGVLAVNHPRGIYPFYAESADGARFRDAAGREYLDWYMSGGAIGLGHRHPAVVEAARRQLDVGGNLSLPATLEIEVAERLCAMVPSAEMVAFGKNGTDVTSAAVKLARIVTRREHVLMCGYHGFQDWSWAATAGSAGIPASYRALVHEFPFNDLATATALMKRWGDRVAAIVVEPVRYDNPLPEFLHGLRALADRFGALLVFDEVVTGFRVARGGIQQVLGIRPDLTCLAKSLANGLSLAALVGARRWMRHMMHASFGMTYRFDATGLAAARATLDLYRDHDVSAHLAEIGELMRSGFAGAAARAGLDWALTSHPALLHIRIGGGGRLERRGAEDLFAQICMKHGIYVRMWRILPSLAHTREDVERTIDVMAEAMVAVRRAMDTGLEGVFDGPIWGELQRPGPSLERPPLHSRSVDAPYVFATAPAAVRDGGLRLSCAAATAESHSLVDGSNVILHAGNWSHSAPATCRVDVVAPIKGRCVVRARYRIEQLPTNFGFVSIQLGAVDRAGREVLLHHDIMFGEMCWSRIDVGEQRHGVPCPYGVREGTLCLEFDRQSVHALHETEWADDLGEFAFAAKGPLQLSFRLAGRIEGGPARVRLLDLVIA